MAKYRKKVLTEAFQWKGEIHSAVKREDDGSFRVYDSLHDSFGDIDPGDYIVTGPKGERYPVRQEVFEATYELVEEPPCEP